MFIQSPSIPNSRHSSNAHVKVRSAQASPLDRKIQKLIAACSINREARTRRDSTILPVHDVACFLLSTSLSLLGVRYLPQVYEAKAQPTPNGMYTKPAYSSSKPYIVMKRVDSDA